MLKKEILELCFLHLLIQEDRYGYALLGQLRAGFPDTQESSLYAILRELCREGCTEQYQGDVSGGPARKYYRLTPAGQEKYAALLERWRQLRNAVGELGVL